MRTAISSVVAKTLCIVIAIAISVACGKKAHFGQPLPSNVPVVKLADILKEPASYKNREVVLQGSYGSYCCASDFSYREGVEGIEVVPTGFESPKVDRGRTVRIYGIVRVGRKPPQEDEEESKGKNVQYDVYIEAKGVQVK